jgi:hypothetical protein
VFNTSERPAAVQEFMRELQPYAFLQHIRAVLCEPFMEDIQTDLRQNSPTWPRNANPLNAYSDQFDAWKDRVKAAGIELPGQQLFDHYMAHIPHEYRAAWDQQKRLHTTHIAVLKKAGVQPANTVFCSQDEAGIRQFRDHFQANPLDGKHGDKDRPTVDANMAAGGVAALPTAAGGEGTAEVKHERYGCQHCTDGHTFGEPKRYYPRYRRTDHSTDNCYYDPNNTTARPASGRRETKCGFRTIRASIPAATTGSAVKLKRKPVAHG